MFFYLSKIFWFLIQPLDFALFLLVAGLLAALLGRRRLAAVSNLFAVLILALSAWTSIGAAMLNPLEERFQRPALPQHVDGIVVLGGGFEGAINLVRGGYELNSGGDRFVETAILARKFPDAKVLVSGGTGTVMLDGEGDADTAVRFLAAFGIPRERLILENKSRNTAENAEFSYQLANPEPGETWLLVTSAFHMPRSVGAVPQGRLPRHRLAGRLPHVGRGRDRPVPRQSRRFAAEHDHGGARMAGSGRLLSVRQDRSAASRAGIGRIDQHLPRRREELPPHQHGDQEQRRQREHLRAGEPAKIAD